MKEGDSIPKHFPVNHKAHLKPNLKTSQDKQALKEHLMVLCFQTKKNLHILVKVDMKGTCNAILENATRGEIWHISDFDTIWKLSCM